jgi:hypothetical protein
MRKSHEKKTSFPPPLAVTEPYEIESELNKVAQIN